MTIPLRCRVHLSIYRRSGQPNGDPDSRDNGLAGGAKEIRTAGPYYGDLDRATVQGQPRLATRALVAAPPADRLDLVGVDLHAERKLIAKIIHSLRLVA